MLSTAFKKLKPVPSTLLLFGLVITLLVFSTQTFDATLSPRFTFFGMLLFSLAALSLILKVKILKVGSFIWPFALFLFIEAFSLLYANTPTEGVFVWFRDAGLVVFLIYFISFFKDKSSALSVVKSIIFVNACIVSYGLYQYISIDAWHNEAGRYEVVSLLGHRNLFSSALVLCLPFCAYAIFCYRTFWRFFAAGIGILNLFLIFSLQSRTVWLAVFVFLVSLPLWKFIAMLFQKISLNKLRTVGIALALIVITSFSIVFFTQKPEQRKGQELISELGFDSDGQKDFTAKERLLLWQASVSMIWEEGYSGVGAGNWKIMFPEYGSDIWRARQGLVQFQRPHNDYLWVFAETGFLGFITYLGGFIWIIILVLKSYSKLERLERVLVSILLSSVLSYFLIAFFSFPRERMFHQLILFSIIGLLLSISGNTKNGTLANGSRLIHVFSILIGMAIIFLGAQWWEGEKTARRINDARISGDWPLLLKTYKKVKHNTFYRIDPMSTPLSFYSGLAYLNMEQYQRAEQEFESAYQLHPYNIHVLNNRANVYFLQGKNDSAIVYYQKSLKVSRKYLDGALNLMAAYYNIGEIENAYTLLREYESVFKDESPDNESLNLYRTVILKAKLQLIIQSEKDNTAVERLLQLDITALKKVHFQSLEEGVPLQKYLLEHTVN